MRWKYLYILFLVTGFSKNAISQGNVFQNNTLSAGYAVGNSRTVTLPNYKDGEYEGNPYFSKDWVKGSVKTIDNQEFGDKLLFMYDKTTGDLYFKKQDSDTIMEADKNKIHSFILIIDHQPHVFIRGESFSPDYAGKFFEVLLLDEKKYSLLKYTTTSFEEPTTSKASQALTESVSTGSYVDKVTYFIYFNNVLQPAEFKKKTFIKALDTKDADKAGVYIKNNSGDFNEAYVIDMLSELNEAGQ